MALIDLSGILEIVGPSRLEDRLDILFDGQSTIDLTGLLVSSSNLMIGAITAPLVEQTEDERDVSGDEPTVAAAIAISDFEAIGETISWTGEGDGLWTDPVNWSAGRVPSRFDDVVIDHPGEVTISIEGARIDVNSISSRESLNIAAGSSLVVFDDSLVEGSLTLGVGSLLSAFGPGVQFNVFGCGDPSWGDYRSTWGTRRLVFRRQRLSRTAS